MKRSVLVLTAATLATAGVVYSASKVNQPQRRGDYVVNRVAMCVDCHTPARSDGRPDQSRPLVGAPIGFRPIARVPNWEDHVPNLTRAGIAGRWTAAQFTTFLSTGRDPGGKTADPPMPAYRLSRLDAEGVVTYIRSLPTTPTRPRTR